MELFSIRIQRTFQLVSTIYGIAPVVNATEVNAFITYYKLKKVNRHEKT